MAKVSFTKLSKIKSLPVKTIEIDGQSIEVE
jgi:hypothetical protein